MNASKNKRLLSVFFSFARCCDYTGAGDTGDNFCKRRQRPDISFLSEMPTNGMTAGGIFPAILARSILYLELFSLQCR